jgi:hypothetical protein
MDNKEEMLAAEDAVLSEDVVMKLADDPQI